MSQHDTHITLPLPRPFNLVVPCLERPALHIIPLVRSGATADFVFPERPLSPIPSTPVRPGGPIISQPPDQIPTAETPLFKKFHAFQPLQASYRKVVPLGLMPRARAFTGSSGRPKFVTPFKQGEKGEKAIAASLLKAPPAQPVHVDKGWDILPNLITNAQRSSQKTVIPCWSFIFFNIIY